MAAPLRRCLAQIAALTRVSYTTCYSQSLHLATQLQRCSISHTVFTPRLPAAALASTKQFHTGACSLNIFRNTDFDEKDVGVKMQSSKWLRYNEVVYPPTKPGEPERPAEVCHSRFNIKYSPKKMWYIAVMIRGMSVDEARKQLSFYRRKGAQSVLEVLDEAVEMAVREHNVEFRSNLWICDSFVGKGRVVKGIRKHRGPRYGLIRYRYVHYFIRLREGKPPKHYYPPPKTGNEKMEDYITYQRARRIHNPL